MSKKELVDQNGLPADGPVLTVTDGEDDATGVSGDTADMDLNELLCGMDGAGAAAPSESAADPPNDGGEGDSILPDSEGAPESDASEKPPVGDRQGELPHRGEPDGEC